MEDLVIYIEACINAPGRVEIPDGNRVDLARLFGELGFRTGAEVGVEKGKYSEVLCQKNPGVKLYAIDAWQTFPAYRDHVTNEELEYFRAETVTRLAPYGCIVIKGLSTEVATRFDDESLDFVYIDGGHDFANVASDLSAWNKKVRPGGVVSGHDYTKKPGSGALNEVVEVVDAWMKAKNIHPWFVLKGDRSNSWFYVKTV